MESRTAVETRAGVGQANSAWTAWSELSPRERLRTSGWIASIVTLTLVFFAPLAALASHAARTELHSHIPLVPFIAAYLLHIQRRSPVAYRTSIAGAAISSAVGLGSLAVAIGWRGGVSFNDYLALTTLAYVCFIAAGGFLFHGARWMAAAAFPIAFLVFMVPLPDAAVNWLEKASVLASADVAALFFSLTGIPLLRDGTVFALPGMVLEVARECSGIRSSWVLFISSLLASHLFLRSWWARLLLVAFVVPLGIVRNAFRIVVIGVLCVNIGPHMIDSAIHRRGGPVFFLLSLVPLCLSLWWLRRQEHRRGLSV